MFVLDPDGNKVSTLSKDVTLYVQIPENFDQHDLEAVHITDKSDEEFDEHTETIDGDNYLVFQTNHFSPYAIIDKNINEMHFLLYILVAVVLFSVALGVLSILYHKTKYYKE